MSTVIVPRGRWTADRNHIIGPDEYWAGFACDERLARRIARGLTQAEAEPHGWVGEFAEPLDVAADVDALAAILEAEPRAEYNPEVLPFVARQARSLAARCRLLEAPTSTARPAAGADRRREG